jgi:hypothetical protein
MDTPSQLLAKKITDRLVKDKLLTLEAAKKMLPSLADGKLRAEDWRLPIELCVARESKL